MEQLPHLYLTPGKTKFDYVDQCQQSDVSAFENAFSVCHSFPSKKQASLTVANM